tara:strand:+ start:1089 stop:1415 length:327 start_codon:yes stop_codon:yes gene_type:complete
MTDPKYPIKNNTQYHIDGYKLPDNEPTMLFRGKDIGSLIAICEYIEMLQEQPQNKTIVSHLESSLERLSAFYNYQKANPHLQSVGCSQKAHDRVQYFFIRAEALLNET